MDTLLEGFPGSFKFDHGSGSVLSCSSNQNLVNGFNVSNEFIDHHHHHPPFLQTDPHPPGYLGSSSDGDSPDSSESYPVLKFINEILMEEDLEGKPCMLQDCLALQAAEKSFYDVLGQKYPPSPNHVLPCLKQNIDNPDEYFTPNSGNDSGESYYASNNLFDSLESTLVLSDLYHQFSRGLGEAQAGKYLSTGESVSPPHRVEEFLGSYDGETHSSYGSRGRKNDQREDFDYLEEGRSSKHSALSLGDLEQSAMLDDILLCKSGTYDSSCPFFKDASDELKRRLQQSEQLKAPNGRKSRTKKRGKGREVVDLWTLLTQCAQAVSSNDQRTANELLKQIRQHSSAFGDGNQRLAYYFAQGLEARLAGTQTPMFVHASINASASDILKAYRIHVTSCPFPRMSFLMANRTIAKIAEKATRLHIIDFGICYGFQWPCLIHLFSTRPGGPPMLRITGIDLPQPGFRPAERVEETGRRLESYCKRFGVPFEYSAIAQKWETIKLEDLNIDREEVTVVNSMYRMKNLPDDTMMDSSPRDDVLKLIKSINPDIFIHGVVNGTHNAPFFLTRFREALFHYSAYFDMFDATVPSEDEGRILFEREVFGREAMNVIACEGAERVERPETYKQWQVRDQRAGFRKVKLDQEILGKVRSIVKSNYHQDFIVDEDGHWLLQGWKGRIIHALSFWKPVQD